MLIPMRSVLQKKGEKFYRLLGRAEVLEEYGIKAQQVVDYLSLLGDSSDNVPGVKGIGEKGAVKLLSQFESLMVYMPISSS